ncbi:hypothetical protein PPYR_15683 [Photinus pyralis]|uniref:Uncharacterized protein n=1 Tax=Photinus pyralis TaxID=7054 RepID=A0A5N4A083_PHOPY|nr:hypothetical protein PPYR_15683 [Photinus pyralis]
MENGAMLIRNRKFIKINYKRNCPSFTMRKEGSEQDVVRNDIRPEPTKVYIDIENENNNVIENKSELAPGDIVTKSGRIVKAPVKLDL